MWEAERPPPGEGGNQAWNVSDPCKALFKAAWEGQAPSMGLGYLGRRVYVCVCVRVCACMCMRVCACAQPCICAEIHARCLGVLGLMIALGFPKGSFVQWLRPWALEAQDLGLSSTSAAPGLCDQRQAAQPL